jgi:hypothetical protein
MVTRASYGIGAIIASLSLFLIYHVAVFSIDFLPHRFRSQVSVPVITNLLNSNLWIIKHREKNDAQSVTLVVQSLRNFIMVAIFVG